MDNNTFEFGLAALTVIQTSVLAWIAYKTHSTGTVVSDIKDGLTSSKNAALIDAASKTGELAGRDFAAKNGEPPTPYAVP